MKKVKFFSLVAVTVFVNLFSATTFDATEKGGIQAGVAKITAQTEFKEIYQSDNLTGDDIKKMTDGTCYMPNKDISANDLRKVTVTYFGFDDKPHYGVVVVNESVATDIMDIFKELYTAKYPIDKMIPIEAYAGDDDKSMADNNTSSFNYRKVAGTTKLSNHAYGLAIDINPFINPYVSGKYVSPVDGKKYTDRSLSEKGMIKKDDACYKAFTSRGWTWGGDWKSPKDYQHFEKAIDK